MPDDTAPHDAAAPAWPLFLSAGDLPPALLFGDRPTAGEIVLGGYANLFPAAYFRAHAPDLAVALRLEGRGAVEVFIELDSADGRSPVATATADLATQAVWTSAPLRLSDLPEDGALSVRLRSGPDAEITRAAWVAASAPERAPKISVGITTFNRPEAARAAAETLAAAPEVTEARIVNQGDPLPGPFPEGVAIINQPNLGGAGGFARGLIEALSAGRATHHVFMDDDAAAAPEIFARLAFFLAHAKDDLAIGAQMLAAEDPMVMAEFGLRLSAGFAPAHLGRGLRVDSEAARALFLNPTRIDAHAWWFWAFPLTAARQAGLPLPVFIKFDDAEYSDRLQREGTPTVALPGLFVRHPAIHMKGADWSPYYLARNAAVAASCFGRGGPGRAYGFLTAIGSLLRHEYMRAGLEAAALRDFLAGPEAHLAGSAEARHARIRSIAARGPKPEARPLPADAPVHANDRGGAIPRYVAAFALALLPLPRRQPVVWTAADPIDPLLASRRAWLRPLADPEMAEAFPFRRGRFLRALPGALALAIRFALAGPAAARRWRDAAPRLTSEAEWRRAFDGD